MKKYTLLLVVIALMSIACSVFAEVDIFETSWIGDVKEDAVVEDFIGEWTMHTYIYDEIELAVAWFGTYDMSIREDGTLYLDIFDHIYYDIEYSFSDGILSGEFFDSEIDCDSKFAIQYYSGDAVILTLDEVTPKGTWETKYIYARQDEIPEVNIMEMIGANQ